MSDLDRFLQAVNDTLADLSSLKKIPDPTRAVDAWEDGYMIHVRVKTPTWSDVLIIKNKLAQDYLSVLDNPEGNSPRFTSSRRDQWTAVVLDFCLADHAGGLDFLSEREGRHCMSLMDQLGSEQWIRPLVDRIRKEGVCRENKSLLFELRFAADLCRLGLRATYEFDAGAGGTVDFLVQDAYSWLVELVRIEPSQAVKRATRKVGPCLEARLCSDSKDRKQTEEAELIRVQEKIAEKVSRDGKPSKFPPPQDGVFHIVLVDTRNCGLTGADRLDCQEIAYGILGFQPEQRLFAHKWRNQEGHLVSIKGVFEEEHPLPAMQFVRDRIHAVGFAGEKDYGAGCFLRQVYYCGNPALFGTPETWRRVYDSIPFRPEALDP